MATETKTKTLNNFLKKDSTIKSIESLKAVLYALITGLILLIISGNSSFIPNMFNGFWDKNFGNSLFTANTIAKLSYLLPLGLALMVSFRMKLFNIGAAGQAIGGGLFAYIIGSNLNAFGFGWLFALIIASLSGALIAALIGFLKVEFKINEVISSIMINWMVFYFMKAVIYPGNLSLLEGGDLRMDWIYDLFNVTSGKINFGLFIAIPLPFIFWFMYKKTNWGYKQDLIGNNPKTGDYLGIDSSKEIIRTMALSGALAGLAGGIYFIGYNVNLPTDQQKDIMPWAFDGITIALLGFNSPIGIIGSSFIFSLFDDSIDQTIGDYGIISVMVAVMILSVARSTYKIEYGSRGYLKRIKLKFSGGDR